jgi:xanthine dehydrogenase/oxidase
MTSPAAPVADHILFYVNGQRVRLPASAAVDATLLHYLRDVRALTGAKLGCGEGGCGACTVLVTRFNRDTKKLDHRAVNACLIPVPALDGSAVTYVFNCF